MNQYHGRLPRLTIACVLAVSAQMWPHQARGSAGAALPALETAEAPQMPQLRPPTRHLPGWPQPTLPAERIAPGAEPMAMLPAEQHMGEFSEADLAFIMRAAVIGRGQSIYAKLALRRAKGADVRGIAQRLVAFHRKAATDLANVVQPYGVVLPSGLDAEHQWLRAHLLEADGKAFDRLYLKSQIDEHASAVRIFRDQINHGKSHQLRAWARSVLGGLEEHHQMLQSLYAPKPLS